MSGRHFTREQIGSFPDGSLKSIIATTKPNGIFEAEVRWAKEELTRRGVDYGDCLEPGEARAATRIA